MTAPLIRAFQWDLARQVERLEVLLELLPRYADWGYQELYLHLEDAIEYPSFPEIARTDAYSQKELQRLVRAAARAGIRVVPIVNLLGHTQYLVKTRSLRDLNELRDDDGSPLDRGQICPLHPRLPGVVERLLRDVAPFCTAGKVHVGLDESFLLGKCPRCREEIKRIGLAGHFAAHVARLDGIVRSLGLRTGLWGDMLAFVPGAIARLPQDVAVYDWYYYPFRRHPRVEFFNFAENDPAPSLLRRGIEYWGCPMNGAFRYEPLPTFRDRLANLRSWWARCRDTHASGFLVTSWEPYRLALEMTTVVDAAAAELWLNPAGDHGDEAMLTAGFRRVFGGSRARQAARSALAADKYPFAGYARWEMNGRWDGTVAGGLRQARAEERHFARLSRLPGPAPLRHSIAFRRYLAERDAFVHRAANGVCALRRLACKTGGQPWSRAGGVLLARLYTETFAFAKNLAAGRRAARAMWNRTRDPRVRGQNMDILDADSRRLLGWRRWLHSAAGRPARAMEPSPVFGWWQLEFVVCNFAPAVQRVVVQQQEPNGSWRELAGRHTIEFDAAAAVPKADIRRPFSVPVDTPDARLRIEVQGVGQVAVEDLSLKNGVVTLHPARAKKRILLGSPAPKSGFPFPAAKPAGLTLKFGFGK